MSHLDMAQTDVNAAATRRWTTTPGVRPSLWTAGWIGLALLAAASFLPPRFSATATVAFEVGAQPQATAVRGVAQMLASRELAYDAVRLLSPEDSRRIAAGGIAGRLTLPRARSEARPDGIGAAWVLMDRIVVEPVQGGRALRLILSAPTPGLAARAAEAYVSALLALDQAARAGQNELAPIPEMRRGEPARASFLPQPPAPLTLGLLAVAAFLLILARLRWHASPEHEGRVDAAMLPVEIARTHRIAWIGGSNGGGLDTAGAVERLTAHVRAARGTARLILFTSDDLPEASAACAIALARHLSEDAGVAFVALDGAAGSLAGLVADPRAPGMSELLFGVAGFGETIHRDARSWAHLIPPGRDVISGPAMVSADRLPLVLEALKRTYEVVVVAAPSLSGAPAEVRLADLDPLVVCLNRDDAPPTSAVETFDALAERRFARVVMLCLATGGDGAETPEAGEVPQPIPSFEAADQSVIAPIRLAGAA